MKKISIEIGEDVFEILTMYSIHAGCLTPGDAILDAIRDATDTPGSETIFGNMSEIVTVLIESKSENPKE